MLSLKFFENERGLFREKIAMAIGDSCTQQLCRSFVPYAISIPLGDSEVVSLVSIR